MCGAGPRLGFVGLVSTRNSQADATVRALFSLLTCVPDLSALTDSVKQLKTDLKALTCQLVSLKNNGEEGMGFANLWLILHSEAP